MLKQLAILISALFCAIIGLNAQITVPIIGTATIPSNAVTQIFITTVTNVYVSVTNVTVTNVFVTNVTITPDATLTPLVGTVIDPALGQRLVKTVVAPVTLSLAPFAGTNWTTLYVQNPANLAVTWPSTNRVRYPHGVPNSTNSFSAVLFENINGEYIGTQ